MLRLQAVGDHETDLCATTGVVSNGDPKQAAPEPPNLLPWSIAPTRATCCCDLAATVAVRAAGGPEGFNRPLFSRSLSRAPCI